MEVVLYILAALLAIFVVIVIHELGHFTVARLVGVNVLKFSIGFGKSIWSFTSKKSGTEYAIGMIPFGGFVKMQGEADEIVGVKQTAKSTLNTSGSYNQKSVWARMAITLAGPAANFILAIILFWAVMLGNVVHVKPVVGKVTAESIVAKSGLQAGDEILQIGSRKVQSWSQVVMAFVRYAGNQHITLKVQTKHHAIVSRKMNLSKWGVRGRRPDVLKSLGITPYVPPIPAVIATVEPGSPAAKAGIKANDKILRLAGKPVHDWNDAVISIVNHPGEVVFMQTTRNGVQQTHQVRLSHRKLNGKAVGYLGVIVKPPQWPADLLTTQKYSALAAWVPAVQKTWQLIVFNSIVLVKLIEGNISVRTLGGPIAIFQNAGQASQAGILIYLGFIGFVSVTLGFINLLPIPILDGGHFLFQLLEAVFRRPVPMRYQYGALKIGFLLLLLLMVQATVNDISRLF